jgi:hypothetical protein
MLTRIAIVFVINKINTYYLKQKANSSKHNTYALI